MKSPHMRAFFCTRASRISALLFGQTVRNQTAAIAQELSGKDGTAAKTAAQTASDKAKTGGDQKHTLDTYVNQVGK